MADVADILQRPDGPSYRQDFAPWLIDVTDTLPPAADPALDAAVAALLDGEIIGWWHGRAEVGAPSFDHRSILTGMPLSRRR